MSKIKRTRPRVIYQNEFLYSSFDATGYHFNNSTTHDLNCQLRNLHWDSCSGNQVRQLHRIQAINYSSITNLLDVNQYGSLARVGVLSADTPDVTLDIEYLLSDGYNEQVAGFITDGYSSAFANHTINDGRVGHNFFIVTVPDHHDVVNYDFASQPENVHVLGIGNAFLTQYAVTAEVGSIPRARLSFEAFNMRAYTGYCNLPLPSVNPKHPTKCPADLRFSIPDTYESFVYGKVKGMDDVVYSKGSLGIPPRSILLSLKDGGYMSKQTSGFNEMDMGGAHIQGFSINAQLGRTKLNRMGGIHAYSRVHNYPMTIEVSIRAIVSDIKESNVKLLFDDDSCQEGHDLEIQMHDKWCVEECEGDLSQTESSMTFIIKNARVSSETFNLDISDHKIVDLKFTSSIVGPDSRGEGLFISGRSFLPQKPKILSWGNPL